MDDRENLSGADQEEEWHEVQRMLLDGFDQIRPIIQGKKNDQTANTRSTEAPF